jgi:putative holliday junction resolvase
VVRFVRREPDDTGRWSRHPKDGRAVRALGLDLGTRRIGVAISDSAGTVATPYTVVERSGDDDRDVEALRALIEETEAEVVVVGLPLGLAGQATAATEAVGTEIGSLRAKLGIAVEVQDERLSTVSAARTLRAAGVTGRKQRRRIDQAAAAVILQSWLDTRR